MTRTRRLLFVTALCLVGLAVVACERTTIGDITADPGRFRDKEVNVAGQVTQSIGVLGKGIYQLDDGTGHLWVWADDRGVPTKGAYVGVKGRITPTVTFLGVNYATVMRETGRKAAKASD
jgi:RecJ-like exonuclease